MMKTVRMTAAVAVAAVLLGLSATPAVAASVDPSDYQVEAFLDGGQEVIALEPDLFTSDNRVVIWIDGRYAGETYAGSAYYTGRWTVGDRVLVRTGGAEVKPGALLEVAIVEGRPGDPLTPQTQRTDLLNETVRPLTTRTLSYSNGDLAPGPASFSVDYLLPSGESVHYHSGLVPPDVWDVTTEIPGNALDLELQVFSANGERRAEWGYPGLIPEGTPRITHYYWGDEFEVEGFALEWV